MQRAFHALLLLGLLSSPAAYAEKPLRIAVAANLLPVMEAFVADYRQETGNQLQIAGGSSGVFYEQIRRDAPFDLFFSADAERPEKLAADGIGSQARTYACGQLALWTPKTKPDLKALPAGPVALAQPDTAPYGKAALEALTRSGLLPELKPRLVYGQDIGQAYQFVLSRNAPSGFVALSQLKSAKVASEQYSLVDPTLYEPLVQKRLLLAKGERGQAAERFLAWFDTRREQLKEAGYGLPGEPGCAD